MCGVALSTGLQSGWKKHWKPAWARSSVPAPVMAAVNYLPMDSDSSFFWIQGASGLGVGETTEPSSFLD